MNENNELIKTANDRETAGLDQDFVKDQPYDPKVMEEYNRKYLACGLSTRQEANMPKETLILTRNQLSDPAPSSVSSAGIHTATVSVSQPSGGISYGQGRAAPRPVSSLATGSALLAQVKRKEPEDEDDESRYRPVLPRKRQKRHE